MEQQKTGRLIRPAALYIGPRPRESEFAGEAVRQ
jgi:citrate synthase